MQSFVYVVVTATLLAIASGCSKKNEVDPQDSGEGSATTKLTQNGQVVTEYKSVNVSGAGGGSYLIAISSIDGKSSLALSIDGELPGTYPFITPGQPLTTGKANLLYLSYDLPEAYPGTAGGLDLASGEVVVTTATKNRCKGTFKGTATNDKNGKTYTIEGTFDARIY